MKKVMYLLLMVLLAAVSQAETITVTDDPAGGGNAYGNCSGWAIDFDSTAPLAAATTTTGWTPALVAGKTYALNSVSFQYGGSVTVGTGIVYLGVYTGDVNGGGFVGASTNAINFNNAVADGWYTFTFSDLNVTVDNVVGSGTGLRYFRFITDRTGTISDQQISTRRLNYDAAMTQGLASIIAYGTLQGARAPHYKADIGSKDTVFMPHDPEVLTANADGSSGTLQPNFTDVEVTFTFKAALNTEQTAVNPNVRGHYIYRTNGTTDPNLYLLDYVPHVNMSDPAVSYGPTMLTNAAGKAFKWKVEEAVDKGGTPAPAGDPNNIKGNEWPFKAVSPTPTIITQPVHTLTTAPGGNATFSVVASATANNFRWYRVVGVKDVAGGETNDVRLTNSGIYSGTLTSTLTITNAASNGSQDAQVYAIAYNGDPGISGTPQVSTNAVWFWYPRLVNSYAMESMTYVGDPNGITPDAVSGKDLHMASNDVGKDYPVLDPNVVSGITGTNSLKFNNPRGTDPNIADAQYARINTGWVGGYKDITISTWVYSRGGSNWNRILDFGNSTTANMFVCVNTGSVNRQLRFAVNTGTEQNVTTANDALPDYEWTFVSCTLAGNTARIYVNGKLVGTNTSFTNDPVTMGTTANNWLGRSQFGSGDGYFNGMIDELKIYNYARTTVQIAQDYQAVKPGWICNMELTALVYDFNGDCEVSLQDFAMFAATWLNSNRIN
jgi:hypothetical protein